MKKELLDILVCPKSKSELVLSKDGQELFCFESKLAYPIRDDIPVLLVDEARTMNEEELQSLQP